MEAATATTAVYDEEQTEVEEHFAEPVVLLTDRASSWYVIEPEDRTRNERGTVVGKLQGTKLAFAKDRAVISEGRRAPGSDKRAFCNGIEQAWTFDQFLAAIKAHPLYNVRFWIEDKAPWNPRPSIPELREQIAAASPSELRELHDTERRTHNRAEALSLLAEAALNGGDVDVGGADGDAD